LRELLEESDFLTIHRLHCYELAPRHLEASLRQTLEHAPDRTRLLFELLYFEEPLRREEAEEVLGVSLTRALEELEILFEPEAGALACRNPLRLIGETLLFTESLERRPEAVYYGEDSQFLRAVSTPRPGEVCADLCTGTGIQGLRCAQVAERVDLVDVHPPAVRLAELNAALNSASDRVEVFAGDLWEALPAERRYDYVVCNPPLMPVAEEVDFPLYGHGGADGLNVVRRLLAGLPERLSEGGRCTVIGACTGDEDQSEIERLAHEVLDPGHRTKIFLLLRSPLRDWVLMIAKTAALYSESLSFSNAVLNSRLAYRQRPDDTMVYTYLLQTTKVPGTGTCEIIDYSRVGQRSFWFVNRGTIAE